MMMTKQKTSTGNNNNDNEYIGGTAYQDYHKQQKEINEKNREKYEIIPSKKPSPQLLKLQEQKKNILDNFVWNDRDLKAYRDIGMDPPPRLYEAEKRFLQEVDISKGPITRKVVAMVRLKAPDWSSPKNERKEFVYYYEDWFGYSWNGAPYFHPVRWHMEGYYKKQFTSPKYGERGDIIDYKLDPTKEQKIYLIPFSKKAVDDIIAKYPDTDKDAIVYTIKFDVKDSFAGNSQRSSENTFNYEDFVMKWEEIYKKHTMPPAKVWHKYYRTKGKTADSLNFEPT